LFRREKFAAPRRAAAPAHDGAGGGGTASRRGFGRSLRDRGQERRGPRNAARDRAARPAGASSAVAGGRERGVARRRAFSAGGAEPKPRSCI